MSSLEANPEVGRANTAPTPADTSPTLVGAESPSPAGAELPSPAGAELLEGAPVALGGPRGLDVTRTLPNKHRRMVGAWCFLDAYGPHELAGSAGMRVGPHPHIGLQTVSWLVAGEILHRDSLGSLQEIRPGQLNLMTAGRGISHSEETPATHGDVLQGVQLWVALPDADRDVPPSFAHHPDLPVFTDGGLTATVLMGELAGAVSPARCFTPLVGAEITLTAGTDAAVPLRPDFEYAVLALDGAATVAGSTLKPGPLLYLGAGRSELRLGAGSDARLMLLGGEPFEERIVMWWNYIGRDHDEIVAAREAWESRAMAPDPMAPDLGAGNPGAADPAAGNPGAADPAAGNPGAADPAVGIPGVGDAGVGDAGGPHGLGYARRGVGRVPPAVPGSGPGAVGNSDGGRFGRVRGYAGPDIPAPPMPITRLVARGRTR